MLNTGIRSSLRLVRYFADGQTKGVFAGASLVFFAYFGFDAVSTAADEAKNPQRDMPIGLIAALLFVP